MVSELLEGLIQAIKLIVTGDPTVLTITIRSVFVSGMATLLATSWGAPLGIFMGLKEFPGKTILKGFFNALLGIPTVALGLVLYLLFSRAGPLGIFHLLYTPYVIIIGQSILITPLIISFITTAIEAVDSGIADLAKTLGSLRADDIGPILANLPDDLVQLVYNSARPRDKSKFFNSLSPGRAGRIVRQMVGKVNKKN